MNERRVNRRFFLKALGILLGASTVAVGEKVVQYSLPPSETGPITEEDIQEKIFVTEGNPPPIFEVKRRGKIRKIKPVADIRFFAQEIIQIAQKYDPEQGVIDVFSFLNKNPLEIYLSGYNPKRVENSNKTNTPQHGGYEAALSGPFQWGPVLTFYKDFLRRYYEAERAGHDSTDKLAGQDWWIRDELQKLWLDVQNPIKHVIDLYKFNISEQAARFGLNPEFHFRNHPVEKEAMEKTIELAESIKSDVKSGNKRVDQVYGQFFSFDEVG